MPGSSFDQLTELDQSLDYEAVDVFVSVSRLYIHFKEQHLRIRGAAPIRNGIAPETEIDFLLSTEIVAKRVLDLRTYALWQRFSADSPEAVERLLPSSIKKTLATHWGPIFFGFPKLFKSAQHAWNVDQLREARQTKRIAEQEAKQAVREAEMLLSAEPELNTHPEISNEDLPFSANL